MSPRPMLQSSHGRTLLLAACAFALGFLLTGCGGSGSGASGVATCGSPDTHCAPKP